MSDFKKVKLFKLAPELGVTWERLVQHLNENGFADALEGEGLNAKVVDEEAYFALLSEFSKDKDHVAKLRALRKDEAARKEADEKARIEAEARAAKEAEEAAAREAEERRRAAELEAEQKRLAEEAEAKRLAEAEAKRLAETEPPAPAIVEAKVEEPVVEVTPVEEPKVEAEAEEAPADEAEVITADRIKLAGTTVVGKIDLTKLGIGPRKGGKTKRPRKGEATTTNLEDPRAALQQAFGVTLPDGGGEGQGAKGRKKGRRGGPVVDAEEVSQNVSATRQAMEAGAGRSRQKMRRNKRDERAAARAEEEAAEEAESGILRVTEFVSTGELANLMNVSVNEIIGWLFASGQMVSINQRLDADTIQLVAAEFGYDVEFIRDVAEVEEIQIEEDDPADLQPRPPVVTVMGHVDHGKTSLLDFIREASVVSGEAGGITQHIGAYQVEVDGKPITFLDTPGHEAFTAMRARGAQATDIVILVVAADDAVMPQTIEAINHAKAAGVPIVVAINKIDKPEANPARVRQQLADYGVQVESYGGDVQEQEVSAKKGTGIAELLDKVLLQAELLDLKANPDRWAQGLVIESRLDKGRGVVATVLVQNGTLEVGDPFVAGMQYGRVRAMFNERDERVEAADPGTPVAILGLHGAPEVGDRLVAMEDERESREIAYRRQQIHREQAMRQRKHITLDEIGRRLALGDFQQLNLVLKGDVGGSVEALSDSLMRLSTPEVAVQIIHTGVGAINESDVMLASASDAVIIGFNVRPTPPARALAEREEIDIRPYSIIYNAIQDVRDALEGLLSPEQSEKTTGSAEVRAIFRVPKVGTIAGCRVVEGKIRRSDKIRLVRDGVVIYTGNIGSLRREKDDVREVASGYECGISIDGYNDLKEGDVIEAFEIVETKRTLEQTA